MSKVVIVGAGPVGLYTAIQLKLYDPSIKIQILEKYAQYQRKHVVKIDKTSFKDSHPDPKFQALLESLEGTVPTQKIEESLKEFASTLGIEIKNETVASCEALVKNYPDADLFIGADGAHSIVRKEIFEDKKSKQNLQYVAEVKYEVQGASRPLSLWSEAYDPLLKSNHLVVEQVGKKQENDKTCVSLRVFLDKKAFQTIKSANFKNPYQWTSTDKQKMDSQLVQTIDVWLKEREKILGDKIVDGSIKISGVKLNVYQSDEVVLEKHNKTWALVGDAAFGVPYFRSLNNGLVCANVLAKKIYSTLHNEQETVNKSFLGIKWQQKVSPLQKYSEKVNEVAQYESFIAKLKAKGLGVLGKHLAYARKALLIDATQDRNEVSLGGRLLMFGMAAAGVGYMMHKAINTNNPEPKKVKNSVRRTVY